MFIANQNFTHKNPQEIYLGTEDIFTVERNCVSRASSPKQQKLLSKSQNFGINLNKIPSYNDVQVRTPSDRKGDIHPGLNSFIMTEFDRNDSSSLYQRKMYNKDSENEQIDSRMSVADEGQDTGNYLEKSSIEAKNDKPPFKILRKCPEVWTKKSTGVYEPNTSGAASMEMFYLHSALNYDENLSEKIKLNINVILKKVFREIHIDNKLNNKCYEFGIKNDYKSINIDRLIDSFKQTYDFCNNEHPNVYEGNGKFSKGKSIK